MNDFLTQLLATNLQLAPVLQPRIAAFFEPVAPQASGLVETRAFIQARPTDSPASTTPEPAAVSVEQQERWSERVERGSKPALATTPELEPAVTRQPQPMPESRLDTKMPTEPTVSERSERRAPESEEHAKSPATVRPQIQLLSQVHPIPPDASVPAQPPVVRVTIGKIEVRAISAPEPAATSRTKAKEPPKLSLEEYLKSRERGAS